MYYVNNIINTIVGFIFLAIICLVIFGLPAAMTVWNIISLTPKKDKVKNRRKKDIATLLLGFCLTAVMIKLISSYHWDEPVIIGGDLFSILHEPFSSDYVLSLVLYAALPIACMMIAGREKLLQPLVGAFCPAAMPPRREYIPHAPEIRSNVRSFPCRICSRCRCPGRKSP